MDDPTRRIPAELSPRVLLAAYASGAFPMPHPDDPSEMLWFSPDPRALLPLDERFHVSRRLRRTIRAGRFVCTIDRAFRAVMLGCADRRADGREGSGTWITPDFLAAYTRLHELGFAHCVEAWPALEAREPTGDRHPAGKPVPFRPECTPVGGVYGVSIGGAFFAESMFHRATDAGKVALVALIEHLRRQGFLLCDVQWTTPHLETFGAVEVPRAEYLSLLAGAIARRVTFGP